MYELLLSQPRFKMPPLHFWLDPSDQPVGSTVITDKSGNNISVANTGVTVSDDSPIEGMKSMQFTGGSYKYLRIPHAEMGNLRAGNFTIEYWAKLEGTDGNRAIFAQWAQKANGGGVLLLATNTANACQLHFGPVNENGHIINKEIYPENGWVHFTWIRAGSSWTQFINGIRNVTISEDKEGTPIDVDYMLGAYFDPSGNVGTPTGKPLIGKIADFRIYRAPAHQFNFDPITGDEYLGELPEADILTKAEFISKSGFVGGSALANTLSWLKFRVNGKTVLIAKKPVLSNVIWKQFNDQNLLGGKKVIANDGNTYKIRLAYGAEANPTSWETQYPHLSKVSEYDRTLVGVTSGKFARMTNADLGITTGNARAAVCMETLKGNTARCIIRAFNGNVTDIVSYETAPMVGTNLNAYCWRPVLELTDPLPVYPDSGPGGKALYYGDLESGYFGRVASSLLPTQTVIEAAGGSPLTTGTVVNNAAVANDLWLKFAYKGKILYIPRRGLRTGVTWEAVYKAGLVYGTDDDGKYPHGSPKNQKAYVQGTDETGRKIWFKVRLMSGMATDPASPFDSDVAVKAKGTEYYKTMERVIPAVGVDQAWDTTGFQSGNIILQETVTGSTGITGGFNCVGNGNSNAGTRGSAQKAGTVGSWYPCLELMPLDFDPYPVIAHSGPGAQKLKEYEFPTQVGYFGRVTGAEMPAIGVIEAAAKTALPGTRTTYAANPTWLKFIRGGKVFFIPTESMRTGASWNALYQAGMVYGTDDTGVVKGTPEVNQLTLVSFVDAASKKWWFKVRLISITTVNPFDPSAFDATPGANKALAGECSQTFQRACIHLSTPLKWDDLPQKQPLPLGIETNSAAPALSPHMLPSWNNYSQINKATVPDTGNAGWYPVLELMPEDYDPFPTIPDNGPGNKKLQEYNPSTQSGYFGRVAATDMPSIDSIEAAGAKSVGGTRNPSTSTMSWLKFVRKGKVFYYPSVALRTGTDWNSIYAAGFVYGVDGNGKYPATPAVNQRRTVTFVDGDGATWTFLVRLASMSSVDPYSHTASGQQAALSEYTEAIQNVYENSPLKWDNLPRKVALGIETNGTYNVSAAMTATDFNAISNWPKDGNAGKKEWFPVLELIPNP